MRRVALVIKEDPQGVLETLKTQKQLSHHRGVFTQIHLTSTLRIAGLTRKGTFYINAVQPSNHPNPLKRQSVPLATEYEAICSEAEHRLAAGLSERKVGIFLDAVVAMAEPVKTHFLWRPQLRDPGDEMVLEAAVNGRADLLVTFNVRDFGPVPSRFGIAVMIPRDALERIRQ